MLLKAVRHHNAQPRVNLETFCQEECLAACYMFEISEGTRNLGENTALQTGNVRSS